MPSKSAGTVFVQLDSVLVRNVQVHSGSAKEQLGEPLFVFSYTALVIGVWIAGRVVGCCRAFAVMILHDLSAPSYLHVSEGARLLAAVCRCRCTF